MSNVLVPWEVNINMFWELVPMIYNKDNKINLSNKSKSSSKESVYFIQNIQVNLIYKHVH